MVCGRDIGYVMDVWFPSALSQPCLQVLRRPTPPERDKRGGDRRAGGTQRWGILSVVERKGTAGGRERRDAVEQCVGSLGRQRVQDAFGQPRRGFIGSEPSADQGVGPVGAEVDAD